MRSARWLLFMMILVSSCHSTRTVVQQNSIIRHAKGEVNAYTNLYAGFAVTEMGRTGIPASITLAQGIIESDYGRSRLAYEANNHFGIKCHSDWKGKKIYHDDDKRQECFRRYSRVEDSFKDHSDFLVDGSRYDFLFDLKMDDYKGWARGLKKAGYATNPKYASMLINTIEENRLYLYDNISSGRSSVDNRQVSNEDYQNVIDPVVADQKLLEEDIDNFVVSRNKMRTGIRNRIQYVIIKESDTYGTLASEFNLLSWELFRYNDLEDGRELTLGMLLYLQPKRNRAEAGEEFHIVEEGESMWSISQLYGVKLKILYERNRIISGADPDVGTELWLRRTKPEGL